MSNAKTLELLIMGNSNANYSRSKSLPEEQLLQITKHKTAKAIWDALKTRHIGEERVQQARLQALKSEFEMLHMKEDETIDTFTAKLTTIVNKAASLGHTMEDETLVRKLLNVVPDRTKPNEQSNLVEEDLEPTLLMAILEDEEEQNVSLHEEDVGYKETNKDSLWYLDNGASNHMTGIREHFKELDEKVSGKVRFGDGSYIEIKGKGSILIECDDEKQRIISHVSTSPLDLVYGDLCGPITPPTPSGKKYIFLLVDDYSRYMWAYFLKSKDQAFDTFKEYKKSIENKLRTTLKMLRTDRGGEFTSNEFTQYLKENDDKALNGILRKRTKDLKSIDYLNHTTPRICVSRDVKFKENETWDWKDYMSELINDEPEWTDFRIGDLEATNEHHDQGFQPIEEDNEFPNNDDDDDYASPSRDSPLHSQTPHTPSTQSSEINSQVTPNFSTQSYYQSDNDSIQITNSPSHFDHTPLRGFRTLNDLYENTEELLLAEDEPKNYKEASSDQKWIEAMKVELDSINRNNTWELTTLPKGHKAIGLKWVFKTKKDANGNIIKHKARLVAKGYIQQHGIDFEEVFAPVARMETIRLLLAIAANNKWEVHHLDVKSAFLHGDLKEEVYVTQPEGFVKRQDNGKVYRLIKALYGLRQAPRAWNIKLDNTLKSLDFKKCALEQAIYTKTSKDSTLLIGVYVDDLIITGTPKKEIDKFKAQMEEIEGDISIRQSAYAIKILKEAGMIDCNETLIPMDPGTRLTKITEGTMVNSTEYRSLIGCLRYLLHTRPDLSYSVGLLSRFMQEPREQHMKAIRQVLRYVKGTKDYGITYKHNGGNKIYGYNDSSYGVNTQEGKGTTGIIFYYGESPISWSTQKQASVALSSCESEFIAATAAATQVLWLKRLLSKLTHSQEEKVTIQVDNKSAIALMKNPVFHERSKHIDTKYHFIRECVEKEDIQVEFINGEYQKANILTKAASKIKFLTMRQLIGLKDLRHSKEALKAVISPGGDTFGADYPVFRTSEQEKITKQFVLILLKMLSEYIDMNTVLPALSSEVFTVLVLEMLKYFNTRACQLVLGAGAMLQRELESNARKEA
ncbi:ribonuclease H-like domain, reverse transcriptase, RNA-dependent DNA polymerase [Tanacetum coccineum]|uniref:Ribonuclease H-like domain, reverse transcriptase, RNA-dependent DNA polymerase n=1 Tax=Tanacetum coccineum TaxID=301880 RepID=A0ABQ5DQM1_9ASTR